MEINCKYCNKTYEKKQSKAAHEKWCNPNTKPDISKTKNPMWGKSGKNQWSDVDWSEVPFEKLGRSKRRERLLEEANYSCVMCGYDKRRADGTVILQVDHIDGDNKNDNKNNLRVLCPNCHAVYSDKFMHIGQSHSVLTRQRLSESRAVVSPRFPKPLKE